MADNKEAMNVTDQESDMPRTVRWFWPIDSGFSVRETGTCL